VRLFLGSLVVFGGMALVVLLLSGCPTH